MLSLKKTHKTTAPLAAFISLSLQHKNEMVLRVTGWSMGCTLGPEATVVVSPLRRSPRIGEIVVVRTDSELMAHRVITVRSEGVLTKGDNCVNADPPALQEDVIGLVTGIDQGGRIRVPWHWRQPAATIIARLSGWEAEGPAAVKSLLVALHRFWQLKIMWRFVALEDRTNGRL